MEANVACADLEDLVESLVPDTPMHCAWPVPVPTCRRTATYINCLSFAAFFCVFGFST